MKTLHWTLQDLELLPDDGSRYEIIDGELYVSKQPDWQHQLVCSQLVILLGVWNEQSQTGFVTQEPGIIFANDSNVIPDVIWISQERLKTVLQPDRKLHNSPELVIEVLSSGTENERRDREVKLKLYSRRGVKEYWVVNWEAQSLEVYRREDSVLTLEKTLEGKVSQIFKNL
jgi:Uma2 family endonuclease